MAASHGGEPKQSWCPSGDPNLPETVVLGVQDYERGEVTYLADPIPAAEALSMVPEGVPPTRILRFASHCSSACGHRDGPDCTLIQRIMAVPPKESTPTAVPRCHLRAQCKWWDQVGMEACLRCPAVSTMHSADDEFGELIANPATTREQLDTWIAENPSAGLSVKH
ncbi:MAG TPA: hypothetical protein VGX23_16650 [Actinocrinis sp.]|nr:hypothetical protein [Actinocrinis sp.]